MKPIRIQRKRVKGWKMPENTVSVTRPGRWGNPFVIGGYYKRGDENPNGAFRMLYTRCIDFNYLTPDHVKIETAEQAIEWYKWYLEETKLDITPLRGKNLACFCKVGDPCHADVLLEIANK